jgi:hypothetical protein
MLNNFFLSESRTLTREWGCAFGREPFNPLGILIGCARLLPNASY